MNKIAILSGFLVWISLLTACGNSENLHSVGINGRLISSGDEVSFITPAGSVVSHAVSDLVNKPYMISVFPAGFSPGNDLPIDQIWGRVPENLEINFVTEPTYEDGPYDIVLAVYVVTEVAEELMTFGSHAPAPVQGDLATFTIDQSSVRDGDPTIMPGVLRLNVEGADTFIDAENRTPSDPDEAGAFTAAMTNTIMIIP